MYLSVGIFFIVFYHKNNKNSQSCQIILSLQLSIETKAFKSAQNFFNYSVIW